MRSPEIVDDAVEKNPLNPMTVEVELYPVLTVNGKAAEEMVIGDAPIMTPCEHDEPPEHEMVVVATFNTLPLVPV